MATEKEAHKAREQHSDFLTELGAHAILVDEVNREGSNTFGVIALLEKKPKQQIPPSLEIKSGKKKVEVPLDIRVTPMGKLE